MKRDFSIVSRRRRWWSTRQTEKYGKYLYKNLSPSHSLLISSNRIGVCGTSQSTMNLLTLPLLLLLAARAHNLFLSKKAEQSSQETGGTNTKKCRMKIIKLKMYSTCVLAAMPSIKLFEFFIKLTKIEHSSR